MPLSASKWDYFKRKNSLQTKTNRIQSIEIVRSISLAHYYLPFFNIFIQDENNCAHSNIICTS